MDAEARRRAIQHLIREWLEAPDYTASDYTTLEMRIDRFVADALAQAGREREELYAEARDACGKAVIELARQAEEIARLRAELEQHHCACCALKIGTW